MPTFTNPWADRPAIIRPSGPEVADKTVESRVVRSQFADGYEQVREDGANAHPVTAQLTFVGLSNAAASKLEGEAKWAVTNPVTYTCPGDVERVYRVTAGSLTTEQAGAGVLSVSFTLKEAFGFSKDSTQTITAVT